MALSILRRIPPGEWTADDVRALPDDGNRYEVIDGVLFVSPSPRQVHQQVLTTLQGELYIYLKQLGRQRTLYCSPADISWSEKHLVQPDLFVLAPNELTGEWQDAQTLLLAVEVVSPSSVRADYMVKQHLYMKYGVREYWIIDPKQQCVTVWRQGASPAVEVRDTLSWQPDSVLASPVSATPEPFVIELAQLWETK